MEMEHVVSRVLLLIWVWLKINLKLDGCGVLEAQLNRDQVCLKLGEWQEATGSMPYG